ncbi:uncharacterized protein TRIADDRAFT_53843 [Trichoplax adhaerens]|uniref:Fibronectin type-III domain-containing protein n=1 Tax=Trichoplax adhaerens TaxID=10228 RepID=B3RQB3_TRIAD|nr:hypothetical protein TRIADDRAFT_53843 [Trichoplax adhaerens]EDV27796.1 hypothetical protein TRIADDRAFT_53843 [Trichoplax adhaerens]|eukprot:XP_002109630.1 hypothetical protein TRIADDRAFT_53843 [Trichoplax adhaerens]
MAVVIKNGDNHGNNDRNERKLQRRHTWSCKKAWLGLNNALGSRRLSGAKKRPNRAGPDTWDEEDEEQMHTIQDLVKCICDNNEAELREILKADDVDINQQYFGQLTPLDIAIMLNNQTMIQLLVLNAAEENKALVKDPYARLKQLKQLDGEISSKLKEISAHNVEGAENLTKDGNDKLLDAKGWKLKKELVTKMIQSIDCANLPEPPMEVLLKTRSSTTIIIKYVPSSVDNGSMITNYKIEWSRNSSFVPISGEKIIAYNEKPEHHLMNKHPCYVRVSAYNMSGYGQPKLSNPEFISSKNWYNYSESYQTRKSACVKSLQNIVAEDICRIESALKDNIRANEVNEPVRYARRRSSTLQKFFLPSLKLSKHLKRAIYLSVLFYTPNGKILVSADDLIIPVIEIDDSCFNITQQEMAWFSKLTFAWDKARKMLENMDYCMSTTSNLIRKKILQSVTAYQQAFCISDLGKLYHEPIRGGQKSVIFCLINEIESPNALHTGMSFKWISTNKIGRRLTSSSLDQTNVSEVLMTRTNELIEYHAKSCVTFSRGLYLGYVKLRCTINDIAVMTDASSPNTLPFEKIRDNPIIGRQEIEWLQNVDGKKVKETKVADSRNGSLLNFQKALRSAARKLLWRLDPEEAITQSETMLAKKQYQEIVNLTESLEANWKDMRWIGETACYISGRNKAKLLYSVPLARVLQP